MCSVVYLSIHKVSCADYGVARVTLEAVNVFCSVSKHLKGQLVLPVSDVTCMFWHAGLALRASQAYSWLNVNIVLSV